MCSSAGPGSTMLNVPSASHMYYLSVTSCSCHMCLYCALYTLNPKPFHLLGCGRTRGNGGSMALQGRAGTRALRCGTCTGGICLYGPASAPAVRWESFCSLYPFAVRHRGAGCKK